MPNLLKLVTKSVTNFWFGNLCPLINEIKEIIRKVDMKIILTTEWSLSKSLKWYLRQFFGLPHSLFICLTTHQCLFLHFVTLTFSSLQHGTCFFKVCWSLHHPKLFLSDGQFFDVDLHYYLSLIRAICGHIAFFAT